MKIGYYPGCTLKLKAKRLEETALSALKTLGIEVYELERWNCCGGMYSLAVDDLIHHVAPVRNLIRAKDSGCDYLMTLCSQCYNTLARANLLMKEDKEARNTLNLFMTEETDYNGEVKVIHFLELLRDVVGWENVRRAVVRPLNNLKVAPFYGCSLLRPREVAISNPTNPTLMEEFIEALYATPVRYPEAISCCGSYQVVANPEAGLIRTRNIIRSAKAFGADLIALSCPLCEYNLGAKQAELQVRDPEVKGIPIFYFTSLLDIALGHGESIALETYENPIPG